MISQKILSITAVCELVGRNRRTLWASGRDRTLLMKFEQADRL